MPSTYGDYIWCATVDDYDACDLITIIIILADNPQLCVSVHLSMQVKARKTLVAQREACQWRAS